MGQAFRRAAGKLRSTSIEPSSSRFQNSIDRRPPAEKVHIHNKDPALDGVSKSDAQALEQRDPSYEAMLSQMVGKISTKPGGKLEMGEAFVVQKTQRPLPKLRNTSPDTGRYEERPVAVGTINVAQLRQIMLLHQSKVDEHDGSLGLKEVAEKFRLDAVQLERIFRHVSLPPEDNTSKNRPELED